MYLINFTYKFVSPGLLLEFSVFKQTLPIKESSLQYFIFFIILFINLYVYEY